MKVKKRMKQQDNRGIALVSVLIIITLCFLLSGAIMQVSYMALLSRNVSTASANNFYDAESVVDDMKIELQTVAAAALKVSGGQNTAAYVEQVYNTLTAGSNATPLENVQENLAKFTNLPGATITVDMVNGGIEKGDDYVLIKGVTVDYTDPDTGYYSNITTDIKVRAPYYASTENHPLGTYSMLMGCGSNFTGAGSGALNTGKPAYFLQEGNVYIGRQIAQSWETLATENLSLKLTNYATIIFNGDNVVINGDIYVEQHSVIGLTGKAVEVRGDIILTDGSYLLIGNQTQLTCRDIIIDGKSVNKGEYTNILSGTAYSSYFPYTRNPYLESHSDDTNRVYHYDTVGALKNGGIMVEDNSGKNFFALLTSVGGNFKYRNETGSEVTYPGNLAFDPTITPEEKAQVTVLAQNASTNWQLAETTIEVDARFAETINVAYLQWLENQNFGQLTWNSRAYYAKDGSQETSVPSANVYNIPTTGSFYVPNSGAYGTITEHPMPSFTFTNKEGVTKTYNPLVYIGSSQSTFNSSEVVGKMAIFVCMNSYSVPFNWGEDYIGIFMSAQAVNYSVNEGCSTGYSMLDTDASFAAANKVEMKNFMDPFGNYLLLRDLNPVKVNNTVNSAYLYAYLVNNIFVGGTKSFYEDKGGGSTSVDTSQNENLNLIELENWNKH